ncbi:penicillin-binding transpeptidase domain-containing protein [Amycolatopsis sp. NPDC005003]
MSLDPPAVAGLFVDGYAGASRSLVFAGLVLATTGTVRFLRERQSVEVAAVGAPARHITGGAAVLFRGAGPALGWPLALLVAGFCVGDHLLPRTLVTGAILGLAMAAVVGAAWYLLRRSAGRHGCRAVTGPALAVLSATSTLSLFGFLLVVRLGPARVPNGNLGELFHDGRFAAARDAIGLPLAVFGAGLGAVLLWPWLKRQNSPIGRRRAFSRWRENHRGRFYAVALGLVAVTFIVPAFFTGLTPIYTSAPELGKFLYCLVLAYFVAGHAAVYRNGVAWTKHAELAARFWYPVLLFVAVAAASLIKKDMGPLIPLLVATMAVLGTVLYHHAGRALDADRPGRERRRWARFRQYGRPLVLVLGVLVVVAGVAMLFMPYIGARFVIMADPWTYTWHGTCVPPDAVVPQGVPAPQAPATPPGYTACQFSYADDEAEHRSQMARGLAIMADGGLWGRGLDDTTAGVLQVGDSDFVLAVIWSKLGGATVLLLTALTALLAGALGRIGPSAGRLAPARESAADRARAGRGALDPSRLFATAIGAMVLGQFVFVFATTQNFFAQSGITAPFLSRGGSSTAMLGLAVLVAVALRLNAPAAGPHPRPEPAATPRALGRWRRPSAAAFLLCCALLAVTVAVPYRPNGADRPYCGPTQNMVDSSQCSMDRVAASRRSIELTLDGTLGYRWDTAAGAWVAQGPSTPAVGDLDGLINTDGKNAGLLDSALQSLAAPGTPSTLADRLGAPRQETRTALELTLSRRIQHATATALRTDLDGSAPLAGGAAVLDARSGRVLAMSSAPTALHIDAPPDSGASAAAAQDFENRQKFGPRHADGTIAPTPGCKVAEDGKATVDAAVNCWAWRLRKVPVAAPDPRQEADQRRYVANDPTVTLPSVNEDRAAGHRYGFGSTFKVVVAAAYLRQPGTTADDLLPAPETVPDGGRVIRNHNRGECPGTVQGQISLTAALAVSCNTAFVRLAERLGWPAIRRTALDFGFNDAGQEGRAWLADIDVGLSSSVSGSVDAPDSAGLGNNVLGGGETRGTPLQMATVLAGIANHGLVRQPRVVLAPGTTGEPARDKQVLTGPQADQLRAALAGTTAAGGTASALHAPDGRQLWVKTGTDDPYETTAPPPGSFVRQTAWLVGFVETASGPVSFAVAVETRDEKAGSTRARLVAQQIIESVVEGRG